VLKTSKTRIIGGPDFCDFGEDTLIFPLELDNIEIPVCWLGLLASIYFTRALSSADSHDHVTEAALDVHRRALQAEEVAEDGSH
jgi:hypothetical protein